MELFMLYNIQEVLQETSDLLLYLKKCLKKIYSYFI
jgi:hypothetical protein